MVLMVDIRHWLDEHGQPEPAVRRQALRIARLIEYAGPLARQHGRLTLVECSRRPGRQPCAGLLSVVKCADETIEAHCETCHQEHIVISGWQDTEWADGPMEPLSLEEPVSVASIN